MKSVNIKESKLYDKTLVVGHDMSECSSILELLHANGMSLAEPLKKEQILAIDISKILLKSHHQKSQRIEQIKINKVWDGLALDLCMSNIKHDWWGWADSQAIYLLDYWRSIDSNLAFILVYDTPENFIKKTLNSHGTISSSEFEKAMLSWENYNRVLLKFYNENPTCTLLVNAQQIKKDTSKYLQQVNKQIGFLGINSNQNDIVDTLKKSFKNSETEDILYSKLVKDLLQKYSTVMNIFEELQVVANLPYNHKDNFTYDSFQLISNLLDKKNKYDDLKTKYKKVTKLDKKNKKDITKLTKRLSKQDNINSEFVNKEDYILLLKQFHAVQEELEYFYLKNVELKQNVGEVAKSEISKKLYGAAERIKNQLSYRLGKSMLESSRSFIGILGMPYTLYSEVKEFRNENKTRKKLPPINQYADAHEALRIKKHLSYRLGQTMISCSSSIFCFLKLPFLLKKAYVEFQKDRDN